MFDHYHDMNHDGKVDTYDVAAFHELMDMDGGASSHRAMQSSQKKTNSGNGCSIGILPYVLAGLIVLLIGKGFFALLDLII